MNLFRKSLLASFTLAATLSAPLAFAQATPATPAEPAAPAQAASDAAPAATSNDASAAMGQAPSAKPSWADVDTDHDGSLSKTEAAAMPALGKLFDKADANADGSLSADEYKAYVTAHGGKK